MLLVIRLIKERWREWIKRNEKSMGSNRLYWETRRIATDNHSSSNSKANRNWIRDTKIIIKQLYSSWIKILKTSRKSWSEIKRKVIACEFFIFWTWSLAIFIPNTDSKTYPNNLFTFIQYLIKSNLNGLNGCRCWYRFWWIRGSKI